MGEKGSKHYWSECGQICFVDGWGYGLTPELRSVCLGKEDDIKKFFDTGELNGKVNPTQRQVLMGILEYRQEEGIGTTDTRTANMERAGDNGASRRKPKATRLLSFLSFFFLPKFDLYGQRFQSPHLLWQR